MSLFSTTSSPDTHTHTQSDNQLRLEKLDKNLKETVTRFEECAADYARRSRLTPPVIHHNSRTPPHSRTSSRTITPTPDAHTPPTEDSDRHERDEELG